jgi:hypothetical protein
MVSPPTELGCEGKSRVRAQRAGGGPSVEGFVRADIPLRHSGLRLAMVDVQQGDGLMLQTPDHKVVFIDGGDNKLFARFVAAAFRYERRAAGRGGRHGDHGRRRRLLCRTQ